MKKLSVDGIGYYLSCMMLFNLIYSIKMIIDGLFCPDRINWKSWEYYVDFGSFCIGVLLFVLGLIFTIAIVRHDDSIKTKNTIGRSVKVTELDDLTGENYFTNYSILVLTGLSLPTNYNILSMTLYILVLLTLGAVYIKKDLIYMNPALTVLNFSIYRCHSAEDNQPYVFVIREAKLMDGDIVRYQDISKKIIRINNKEAIEKQVKQCN